MGTTLSTLKPPEGARHRRKRVGRGFASGNGRTAGRGIKGQKSRSGAPIPPGFEGGQMPLQRRLPKRGFKNPFRIDYHGVNVGDLARHFEAGATITEDDLKQRGLMPKGAERAKILGGGELGHQLTVTAHAFSKTARAKIEGAGGAVEVIPRKPKGPKAKQAESVTQAE